MKTWVGHLRVELAENGYWYIADDSISALAGPFDAPFQAHQELDRMFEQETARKAKLTAQNKRSNANRKMRDQIRRDCGLVRVRGELGGVYWE